MALSEKQFLQKLEAWRSKDGEPWRVATSSLRLQAYSRGKLVVDVDPGESYRYYDLASLTKIMLSTTSAMLAVADKDVSLRTPITKWLPELSECSKSVRDLTVRDLLSHSAGMTWWRPFFKSVAKEQGASDGGLRHAAAWAKLMKLVVRDVKKRGASGEQRKAKRGPAIYSDLDFFLLGEILRRSTETEFSQRWMQITDRLGLRDTFFHALAPSEARGGVIFDSARFQNCAPTENDPWRGRVLQGEVHDENTAALRGVSSHSGLFGPIEDVSIYGLELRKLALGENSKLPAAGRGFLRRSVPRERGDWGLGFMLPSKGKASCGPLFSLTSVGHTGFTGTSLWFDPKRDLVVVILANRVHPTRQHPRFLELRPALHTMVVEGL